VTARFLVLLALLLAGCTPNGVGVDQLAQFDSQHARFKSEATALRERAAPDQEAQNRKDFRDRTIGDDFAEWVFNAEVEQEILELRAEAKSAPRAEAERALTRADALVQREAFRARQVADYWRHSAAAPFWRLYWQAFHDANGRSAPAPGADLLDAEKNLGAQLAAGDFVKANKQGSPALVTALRAAFDADTKPLARERARRKLPLEPRRTACGPATAADPAKPEPHYLGGEPLEEFYPREAANRGEEGPVVMLLRISAQGCATARSITVHSGFESLDAAALQWIETAEFAPRRDGGKAVESRL
jgi:TonB family protein